MKLITCSSRCHDNSHIKQVEITNKLQFWQKNVAQYKLQSIIILGNGKILKEQIHSTGHGYAFSKSVL
jgi:hypothetical protein